VVLNQKSFAYGREGIRAEKQDALPTVALAGFSLEFRASNGTLFEEEARGRS
jgi:hypothetical protein